MLRLLRVGTKNTNGCSLGERDEMARERESRREALFQDYRGLPAFWNRADRLLSDIGVSLISRDAVAIFGISDNQVLLANL